MTYTPAKTLTLEGFLSQYGDDPRDERSRYPCTIPEPGSRIRGPVFSKNRASLEEGRSPPPPHPNQSAMLKL